MPFECTWLYDPVLTLDEKEILTELKVRIISGNEVSVRICIQKGLDNFPYTRCHKWLFIHINLVNFILVFQGHVFYCRQGREVSLKILCFTCLIVERPCTTTFCGRIGQKSDSRNWLLLVIALTT